MIASSIDMIVQLGICDEVRRIVSVENLVRDGMRGGIRTEPAFRIVQRLHEPPCWESLLDMDRQPLAEKIGVLP